MINKEAEKDAASGDEYCYISSFGLYQEVTIRGDIHAVITAIQFHAKKFVMIKCEWIANGNPICEWFDEIYLKMLVGIK